MTTGLRMDAQTLQGEVRSKAHVLLCLRCVDWRRDLRCARKQGQQLSVLLATVSLSLHPLSADQISSHEFK